MSKRRRTSKGFEVIKVKKEPGTEDVVMATQAPRKPKIIQLKGGPERKAIDVDPAVYNVSTSGLLTLLNGCVRGTDINQRVGRKITMTSVFIRGHVVQENVGTTPPTATITSIGQLARCMIVYDNEANAGTPLITDVLKSATSYAQLNIDNRDRFTVLMDKQWYIGPATSSGTSTWVAVGANTGYAFKKYIKLRHPVVYNSSNNGDFSDINTGSLWMVWIGNVAAGTGTDVDGKVSTRVRFLDE